MRTILFISCLCLLANTSFTQNCDIAQVGMAVKNAANTIPVNNIAPGQTANFSFTIKNAGSGGCAVPAGSVTALFDFPTIAGGVMPYVYAGPPSFTSGYFSWTYNSRVQVLMGTNTRDIPTGLDDVLIVRVRGNATGSGNSNLNITQGKGISDIAANNFIGAKLVVSGAGSPSIDLSSFTAIAARCAIRLNWTTISEAELSHFDIEYSNDGFSFNKIGSVAAKNLASGATYEFGNTAGVAKGYFRLRQVGKDGQSLYSDDVFATTGCSEKAKISLYPNPVRSDQKLVVNISGYDGKITGELYNSLGQIVKAFSLANMANELSLEKLTAGTYLLQVKEEGGAMQSFKVIVNR